MTPSVQFEIPYGTERLGFSLPSANLIGAYSPHQVPPVHDVAAEIARALAEPVDGPPLSVLARGASRVVIVADDATRLTPTEVIVPLMLDTLNEAGVPDGAIDLLIALGTHRAMTPREIEAKFGADVVRRIPVINHDAFDPDCLVDLGTTPGGVSVQVNHRVMEADLVLGIGTIVPHHIPGFSGGAKIIQPGVCGDRTTGEVHLLSVRREESLLGVLENQVRHEMEEIAERAGLKAVLNTILDPHGGVMGAVYGSPRGALRAGASLSRRVYGVEVPRLADIVVAGSSPCDSEFWQAHKTLYSAELCARPGGTIIVVSPCPEGVSATHLAMLHYAGRPMQEIDAAIRASEIPDLTAGALALAWASTRRRATIALVSGGISEEEARALSFMPFSTIDDALEDAWRRHGAGASVTVLPYAPDTLPLLP